MFRLLTLKRVLLGVGSSVVLLGSGFGVAYAYFPAQSADFLREKTSDEFVFWLEGKLFAVQDWFNQEKYKLLGDTAKNKGEDVEFAVAKPARIIPEAPPFIEDLVPLYEPEPIRKKPDPMPLPEIKDLGVALKEGEGGWRIDDLPRTSADDMLMAKASVRPDLVRPYAVVQAVLFDKRRIDLHIVGGTKHPGGDRGVIGPGLVAEEHRPSLLAAWNGGFQGIHGLNSQYGPDTKGVKRYYRPLLNGFGSVVVYENGSIKLGEWGRDLVFTDDIVSVRQNNILLVDNCEVNPRTREGNATWGYVTAGDTNTFITPRSAIGLTANGDLIVAAGTDLSANSLARALWALGACFAMQLDINRPYVLTSLYYDQPDGSLVAKKTMPTMSPGANMYSSRQPLERDFMYLTVHDFP